MTGIFSKEDLDNAAENPELGPAYFCSRRIAERFITGFAAECFKPLVEEFTKQFSDKLWESISVWLLEDTESNLQTQMHQQVDSCVNALLSGEGWALERYALGSRYDCAKIRAAIASHIPAELQEKRVADLEADVASLKEQLRLREWR